MSWLNRVQEAESKEINLEDDDPEALRKMLIYLYTLNIDHVLLQGEEDEPPETPTTYLEGLLDLFVLADKYELPELSDLITVAVDAFDRGGYRASQFIRAYLKAVSMPDSTLGRSRLLTKLTSALESFRRGWHNVCPIGVEDNETRNRNYAKTVDAVVENPEAAVLLICHLGNMLTVAKAAHVDFEDASRTFDDKSSESAVSTPGADGNSGSASDFSVFDDEDEDTDASSFEWFKVEDEAVLKATSLPKDED
ncbi:uncharacterized protein HMPREF1541_08305 [Cyphellophora europaea CBS 101466]|uniref:BTB domain-containing protein n=1 Tax=Cyphellophora europaea (strain CBS 101466) TaxID=1220924 RepID=W2RNK7_CYPE1|nr:uncharacterized protein HMPREF1541_08305 [Cyphellophora europaea CBS 101466]ETN37314.1 hypothetical protein HMPREF1541_08305 [Cyphellophora europaea CBS 101466]